MANKSVPHFLLTFGGPFYEVESWQCGLRLTLGAVGSTSRANPVNFAAAQLDVYRAAVETWWGSSTSGAALPAKLAWVKFNAIGDDGNYVSDETNRAEVSPVVSGGSYAGGGNPWPQMALALTMNTGRSSRRASRGRIFIPVTDLSVLTNTNPKFATATAVGIATAFKNFIADVNDLPGVDLGQGPRVAVHSSVKVTDARDPLIEEVTSVSVGNMVDTQQRRAKSFDEDYSTVAL